MKDNLRNINNAWLRGIKQKATLIDLFAGPDPNALATEIAAAKAAGTLVAVSHNFGMDATVPNVSANFSVDFSLAARLLADWVISKNETAHVLGWCRTNFLQPPTCAPESPPSSNNSAALAFNIVL